MQTTSELPAWLVPLIPVVLVATWAGVLLLLAYLSGWRALAGRYRATLEAQSRTVFWASAHFNWMGLPVGFGNSLNVGVNARGVELKPVLIFGLSIPRLLIPWEEIGECRSYRLLGIFRRFSFVTAEPRVKITLAGRAAALVDEAYARFNPARPVLASAW